MYLYLRTLYMYDDILTFALDVLRFSASPLAQRSADPEDRYILFSNGIL
jgi:hypothetical protein